MSKKIQKIAGDPIIIHADTLVGVNLERYDLHRAVLNHEDLEGANLSAANLRGAQVRSANLLNANLSSALLMVSSFVKTNLNKCVLIGAKMSGADFRFANLRLANLSEADVWKVNFLESDLRGANMTCQRIEDAILEQSIYDKRTQWPQGFDPQKHGAIFYKEDIYSDVHSLGNILSEMYRNAPHGNQVAYIHLFGIKYGVIILENNMSVRDIIYSSGLSSSYATEVRKGIKLSEYVVPANIELGIYDYRMQWLQGIEPINPDAILYTNLDVHSLGNILSEMYYNAPNDNQVAYIHLFGIKYGNIILKNNMSVSDIVYLSGINPSYATEVSKGIKLSTYVILKN